MQVNYTNVITIILVQLCSKNTTCTSRKYELYIVVSFTKSALIVPSMALWLYVLLLNAKRRECILREGICDLSYHSQEQLQCIAVASLRVMISNDTFWSLGGFYPVRMQLCLANRLTAQHTECSPNACRVQEYIYLLIHRSLLLSMNQSFPI